jgi:hypothetical protein
VVLTDGNRPVKVILAMELQALAEERYGMLLPSATDGAVVERVSEYPVRRLVGAVGFV